VNIEREFQTDSTESFSVFAIMNSKSVTIGEIYLQSLTSLTESVRRFLIFRRWLQANITMCEAIL
jgi:hypothetical protein